jgi:hypothetical protein
MGVTTEQWRVTIGRWSGGRPGKCVVIENSVARKPDNDSYRWFRCFLLVSLLVIGCVELNPGPDSAEVRSVILLTLIYDMFKFYRERYRVNIMGKEEI